MREEFIDSYKVNSKDVNKIVDRKKFLKRIEENDKILNMLTVERLRKLTKYYADIIKQNDEKIKKLRAKK